MDQTIPNVEEHPHIVILKYENEIKILSFDGPKAMTDAHNAAVNAALKGGCAATVALRVRQCGNLKYFLP